MLFLKTYNLQLTTYSLPASLCKIYFTCYKTCDARYNLFSGA